jgi:methanogenic corrinoid protein MtbC1
MTNDIQYGDTGRADDAWPGAHGESLGGAVEEMRTHLEHAVVFDAPELFGDYVAWLETAGRPRGIDGARLRIAVAALDTGDGADNAVARTGLELARRALDAAAPTTAGLPDDDGELVDWRRRYLGFLLAGLRKEALGLLRQAARDGLSADRIYLEILAPTLRDVGWLWQIGRVTVAQEHFCSAVTQFAMASLYDHLDPQESNGRTVLVAGPGDERHEVGARMVADLLEQDGWNAIFLGANTPAGEVPEALAKHRADLLALSCTMTPHLSDLRAAIRAVRADPRTAATPVLVGGRPFALADGLWRRIGADGTADDAASAVCAAASLATRGCAGSRLAG